MANKDYQKEHTDDLMDGMVIARLESHGHDFEIILEADYVNDGKLDEWSDILEHMPSEVVFADAKKGEQASTDDMNEVFATENVKEIAIEILKKGGVQLTTEQRRQMQDDKRKQIITIIVREARKHAAGRAGNVRCGTFSERDGRRARAEPRLSFER